MRIWTKLGLAVTTILVAATPASAGFWDCVVPEIDGSAGVSAIAALASLAIIAYQRKTQ